MSTIRCGSGKDLPHLQRLARCVVLPVLGWVLVSGSGCGTPPQPQSFVARVGNATLTEADIAQLLQNRPAFLDSADAVSQIIEQWVTNELLYQEALARGLRGDPDVRRLLSDNERSVLINALVTRVMDTEIGEGPDEAAIQTYYEQHREQLALREPYVRVRHLIYDHPDTAQVALRLLEESSTARLPVPSTGARSNINQDSFYPERHVFAATPELGGLLIGASVDDVRLVVTSDSMVHVVHLLERLPQGSIPSREMVRDDIRERVMIDMRKQLYSRQVERLRTRAVAREELVIK
jgi:hypothetical protein